MRRRGSNANLQHHNLPAAAVLEKPRNLISFLSYIVDEFRRNGSYSVYTMLFIYTVLLIATAVVVNKDPASKEDDHRVAGQLYTSDSKFVYFYQASILYSLSVSLAAFIDVMMMVVFLRKDIEQKGIPVIEFIRRFILFILAAPNVLIYYEILPANVIDMVLFLQFLAMYYVLMYRLYTLSSAQKVVPFNQLRDIFYSNNLAAYTGFLYKLSLHDLILGKPVFKALFTICIVFSIFFALRKILLWFQFNNRISEVYDKHAKRSTRLSFLGLMVAMSFNVTLAIMHLIYYTEENVFFPNNFKSYMALSWLHCFIAMVYNAFRNFELIKSDFATMDRLDSNRKMTRSISHEIRTPLNTAFLALDLLISTLRAPFVPEKSEELRIELIEITESIREGCDISLGILNQLLTFEKLSAGMMQLESKTICVEQLLNSNMKLFKMQAQQVGVIFKLVENNVDLHKMMVHVDEHKMNQVLRNLLSNAMKFTPKGGVVEIKLTHMYEEVRESTLLENNLQEDTSSRVTKSFRSRDGSILVAGGILSAKQLFNRLSTGSSKSNNGNNTCKTSKYETETSVSVQEGQTQSDSAMNPTKKKKAKLLSSIAHAPVHSVVRQMKTHGTILISIVDSGPGVNKDDQKKLFNEYVQINPGELQKGQGTGLGLSISKAIVHLHGGNIGMTSEGRGKGSTFFMELPCYIDQNFQIKELKNNNSKIFPNLGASSQSDKPGSNSNLSLDASPSKSKSDDHTSPKHGADLVAGGTHNVDIEQGLQSNELRISTVPPTTETVPYSDTNMLSSKSEAVLSDTSKAVPNSSTILTSPTKYKGGGRPTSFICAPQIYKILVVDDSAPNRKMLSRLLTREGHRIFEGDDGTVGVDLVKTALAAQKAEDEKEPTLSRAGSISLDPTVNTAESEFAIVYDFILMDYYMQTMNGPEAARLIREAGYDGPIIGVTGVMGDESTEFINNGADVVLCKPVNVQSIWKALKSIEFIQ